MASVAKGGISLSFGVDGFLSDCSLALSRATLQNYAYNLERFSGYLVVGCSLEVVHDSDIRRYLVWLRGCGYSLSTVHQAYRVLRTFFGFCVRQRWLRCNPMLGVRRPRLSRPVVPYLHIDDVRKK